MSPRPKLQPISGSDESGRTYSDPNSAVPGINPITYFVAEQLAWTFAAFRTLLPPSG